MSRRAVYDSMPDDPHGSPDILLVGRAHPIILILFIYT